MTEPLHLKYRPQTFREVLGHNAICDTLERMVESRESQSFLFYGPSGTGKTTLARITAHEMGAASLLEIDGATHTQVEAMRRVTETLQYRILGSVNGACRGIIVDECHRLSLQAWESLLKSVEEPPPHVLWFFCTTRIERVPPSIKTRCSTFNIKLLSDEDLNTLVNDVCADEKIKISDAIFNLVVRQAKGSPRQALVNLALVRDLKDRKEAASILSAQEDSDPMITLAKFCIKGGSWGTAMALYEKLADEPPESVRIAISNYIGGALRRAKTDREVGHFLGLLDAFGEPYSEQKVASETALLRSIGRALFTRED